MIGNEYKPVGFLQVCCADKELEGEGSGQEEQMFVYEFSSSKMAALESGERVTAESVGRERRISVLHEAIKVVLEPLQYFVLKQFVVKSRELSKWMYIPAMVLYCCDIPESKDTSVVRYSVMVKRQFVTIMVTTQDITSGQVANVRKLIETKMIRGSLLEMRRGNIATVGAENKVVLNRERETNPFCWKIINYHDGHLFRNLYEVAQSTRKEQLSLVDIQVAA